MASLKILLILLILVQTTFASNAEKVLDFAYKTEYDKALREISEGDSSACVLKGIVLVTRFDDLGDTLDLKNALSVLKNCKTNEFWEPYRRYQIGLINESIFEVRGAAQIFKKRTDSDSKAFYAIYDYYSSLIIKPDLSDLKNGFEQSKLFAPVLGNSLIWILYDKKRYSEALEIVASLLERYPEHPVILQIKADMLFKLGQVQEAVSIYEQSIVIYAKRAPNSIRYWCAVSNLAKMTNADIWKEKLKSEEYKVLKHWMPDGL